MTYRKKIRLDYFEVVCKKNTDPVNQPDRIFDLSLWIKKAEGLGLKERTFAYYQEKARLDKFWFMPSQQLWFLNYIKLRETGIPSIAKENQESSPITLGDDEYIGEEACAIYDKSNGILMLQRNFHSLGQKGIEQYLNLLWGCESEMIYLRPICSIELQKKISKAKDYRNLTLKFADIKNNEIEGDEDLKGMFDNLKKYGAISGKVQVSMGYERSGSLDHKSVRETLSNVFRNKGVITKAEISFKTDEDAPIEIIDLFDEKLSDYIYAFLEKRTTLASEYMADLMADKYIESKGKIIASLRER